jgi:hypothetical protein
VAKSKLDKVQDKATGIAVKIVEKMGGNLLNKTSPKSLVKGLRLLMKLYGTDACRRQIIKGIEHTFKDSLKANPSLTTDDLYQNFMADEGNYPEIVTVLNDLGLGEEHIKVIAGQVKEGR